MDNNEALANDPAPIRLKVFRARRGMTQHDVAALIGTSNAEICRYESGNSVPSLRTAAKLELVTGIPAASWVNVAEIAEHVANRAPSARTPDREIERRSRRAS